MQSLTEYLTEAKKLDIPQEILEWFDEHVSIAKAPKNWAKFLEMREDGYAPSKKYANEKFKFIAYTNDEVDRKKFDPSPELPESISKSWFNTNCDEVECAFGQYPFDVLNELQKFPVLYLYVDTLKAQKGISWIEEILNKVRDDACVKSYGMIDAKDFTKDEVKAQFFPRLQKIQDTRGGAADIWFRCSDDTICFTSRSKKFRK